MFDATYRITVFTGTSYRDYYDKYSTGHPDADDKITDSVLIIRQQQQQHFNQLMYIGMPKSREK
jgi:hypothetical protein